MRLAHQRSDRDRAQAEQETGKHPGEQLPRPTRGVGKFTPDEYAPDGGDHRRTLSDGVGNRRADQTGMRGDEVEDSAGGPYDPAQQPGQMRAGAAAPVSAQR